MKTNVIKEDAGLLTLMKRRKKEKLVHISKTLDILRKIQSGIVLPSAEEADTKAQSFSNEKNLVRF